MGTIRQHMVFVCNRPHTNSASYPKWDGNEYWARGSGSAVGLGR